MRVVLAEDQALISDGLVLVMERGGFEVVGRAGDGEELLRKTRAHRPDIVVADIRMPPTQTDEGLRAAIEIRRQWPQIAVVLLSLHVHTAMVGELLAEEIGLGGFGYLLKHRVADGESFCADLRRVAAGGTVLDSEVAAATLSKSDGGDLARLTPRQSEVLALMAEGLSNAKIAERLVITEKAVGKHTTHIYATLDLDREPDMHRRVMAVVRYLDSVA